MNDKFIFRRIYYEKIKNLSRKSAIAVYDAIVCYAIDGIEPKDLNGEEMKIWNKIKIQIDKDNKKWTTTINLSSFTALFTSK